MTARTPSIRAALICATALASLAVAAIVPVRVDAHDAALPPSASAALADVPPGIRVRSLPFRAGQLRLGMTRSEVEQAMQRPAASERAAHPSLEVATFWAGSEEPLGTRVTFRNGRLTAVALDVANVDHPDLPTFMRRVTPGFARAGVIHALGNPQTDYVESIDGMAVEHMIFESPARPVASVFLASDRVISIGAGRDAPTELSSVTLPTAPAAPANGRPIERIRLGMASATVLELCGDATWAVHSSFKGIPVLVLTYATPDESAVTQFKFIGNALTEMSADYPPFAS